MAGKESRIGKVEDDRPEVEAARVHLEDGPLNVGDTVHIKGPETDLEERIEALQLPDGPAEEAHAGDDVGLKVRVPVEEGANVFRVEDPYDEGEANVLDQVFET